MFNGTFENKDPDEAMEYLDLLAENAQNWDTTGTCEAPGKTQPHTSSGVMYNLKEDHDLHLKFASLARKVEALELKKNSQLKSVQEIVCQICETNEHSTNDCPTLPSFNHLNFSWKSGNNNAQTSQPPFQVHHNFQSSHGYASPYVPPPGRNLEDTLHAFIEKQETINTQLAQSMTDFKDTFAKFTSALSFQEVSSHLNHSKIPKGNTIQIQVVLEANTWIKSNQSLLSTVVRLLKKQFLNLVRKMMSQSLRVRKGLNLNIAKNRLIPHQYFHFLVL
jgi:hypothetical protein